MKPPTRQPPRDRLERLRAELQRRGLDGFVVPHSDEFQSEYLPPSAERLAWLTGFTGSAGMAVVLTDEAAVFVDGRYTLQVQSEVATDLFSPQHLIDNPPTKWLATRLTAGKRIGYDPWLMTIAEVRRLASACAKSGAELVAVDTNPIDSVWDDRPAPPVGAVSLHPLALAGRAAEDKIDELKATLRDNDADAAILCQGDSIAWTFNIRGSDIAHNPVPLAYAVISQDRRPEIFIDARKLSNTVRAELGGLSEINEPPRLGAALTAFGAAGRRMLADPQTTPEAIAATIRDAGGTIVDGQDPASLPKATKNQTELDGARRAQRRDGAAMVRFLAWLDSSAGDGAIDEISAADTLAELRADTARRDGSELVDLSFDTISGAGPNGAIVHYRVDTESNRALEAGSLYLVDSGAQYRDGTTDVTRTVAIGEPSAEMRDRFTRVLKGHIAIASARFPVNTTGAQIDVLARNALWRAGLDYDHGTGHGVGAFLSVHEGPARISKLGTAALQPGMILSNEPGYYKTGAFGIRIENLVVVTPPTAIAGGDREMLGFETITLCPIDRRLIAPGLLTREEIDWVDAYHRGLSSPLRSLLDPAERAWLAAATAPLEAM